MDPHIRTIRSEELEAFARANASAFSSTVLPGELERDRAVMEPERTHAAFDGGAIVGGAAAAAFRMAVPGGRVVATAGITGVGVLPSHRRRGINTALMRAQLDDVHERGEPVAALYASEGNIYGRFGYGLASFRGKLDVDAGRTSFVRGYRPSGEVRLLSHHDALASMRSIYDSVAPTWPGMLALDDRWWTWRWTELDLDDEGPAFYALHTSETGEADAYAAYRVKHEWPDGMPRLELSLRDLLATSPQAYADIWRFVFDIDLVGRVTAWNRPADEPLLHLLAEPRRLRLSLGDGLWVRLVDVPAALAARGYQGTGTLTIDVSDEFCPWNEGRFALEVAEGIGVCARTSHDGDADLRCSVNDLGAIYLGGTRFSELQRAGRVSEIVPGSIRRADALFASAPAPWCSITF